MKALLDLDDNDCRYAFGDGPFLFCGDPKQDKSSYCPHHHAICFRTVNELLRRERPDIAAMNHRRRAPAVAVLAEAPE